MKNEVERSTACEVRCEACLQNWTVVGASVLFLPRPMARDSNFRLPITNFQKASSNFYISVLTYPRFTVKGSSPASLDYM